MPHQPEADHLFWHDIFRTRDEARSHLDLGFARPYNATEPETTTVLPWFSELPATLLPDIAAKTTFLREQVSKWDWTPSTDSKFQKLKQWICKTLLKTTLTYYDRTQPLTLHTDTSEHGLGAALLQNEKPIAFASKTLTDMETRYLNIERECLSVVFRLEMFHTYICG